MTAINRKNVRQEIASGLSTAISGTGKIVSSVYAYMKSELNRESPVVLVLSSGTRRKRSGVGTKKYDNDFIIELHILVYDGDNNPLTETQREDKIDDIEQAIADWFSNNQSGTYYRAVDYTEEFTETRPVTYIDGNPYLLEVIRVIPKGAD